VSRGKVVEDMDKRLKKFKKQVQEDMEYGSTDGGPGRILAACKDTDSEIYLLVMAVPPTSLSDGVGPELIQTPIEHKFIVCLNEEMLFEKAQEIDLEDSSNEEKNQSMAEFIAGQLPPLFERARSQIPLDI